MVPVLVLSVDTRGEYSVVQDFLILYCSETCDGS